MANKQNDSGSPQKKSLLQKLREKDFPGIKKDIDDSIYDNVVEPMAKAGYETAGPAIGAGLGAAADFALPDDMADVGLMAMGPIGKVGKAASVVKKMRLDDLKKLMPERAAKAAEDIRLQGFSNLFDEAGNLIATIGEHSTAGKAMKGEAKIAQAAKEAAAPRIDYKKFDETVSAAKAMPKPRKVSGDAAEFLARTGVDPTRKTAMQTLPELQKKSKEEQEAALRKLRGE